MEDSTAQLWGLQREGLNEGLRGGETGGGRGSKAGTGGHVAQLLEFFAFLQLR